MDATDHENIPSAGESNSMSSWMHIGFDYLKHDIGKQTKSAQIMHQKSNSNKTGKRHVVPEIGVSSNQKAKMHHSKTIKYSNEDSGPESASSTNSSPATSPHGSPLTKRRQGANVLISNAQAVSCYNPITWIYKGFFSQESESINSALKVSCAEKVNGNKKPRSSSASDSNRKKFIITNFDINALSPQSW